MPREVPAFPSRLSEKLPQNKWPVVCEQWSIRSMFLTDPSPLPSGHCDGFAHLLCCLESQCVCRFPQAYFAGAIVSTICLATASPAGSLKLICAAQTPLGMDTATYQFVPGRSLPLARCL